MFLTNDSECNFDFFDFQENSEGTSNRDERKSSDYDDDDKLKGDIKNKLIIFVSKLKG